MAKVTMPQLGESVTEGTIGRWLKQPGEAVEKYEPLVEVTTDKVNAEVPSPFAGVLREITAQEGETVDVGTQIAVIAEEAFEYLDGPIRRLTGPDVPAMPFNKKLESEFLPNPERIAQAMRDLAAY